MPRIDRYRALYVFKYLWGNSDEEHPATLVETQKYLAEIGIKPSRKPLIRILPLCRNSGLILSKTRSTQYQYFFASRNFSTFELKLMIDAVQAAHFIFKAQTGELVKRIAGLANKNQSEDLRRNLFVSKLKDNDKNILPMANWLNAAIN